MNIRNHSKSSPLLVKAIPVLTLLLLLGISSPCFATVESSLIQLKQSLTGVILPVVSVIGMALAAISFFTGNPQAKQHVIYAILGCVFGFGAQAIVDLIGSLVR